MNGDAERVGAASAEILRVALRDHQGHAFVSFGGTSDERTRAFGVREAVEALIGGDGLVTVALFAGVGDVLGTTADGERLRALRTGALSRRTLVGLGAFATVAAAAARPQGPRPTDFDRRAAADAIATLQRAIVLARTGELPQEIPARLRDELAALERGERPIGLVRSRIAQLTEILNGLATQTVLPDTPPGAAALGAFARS